MKRIPINPLTISLLILAGCSSSGYINRNYVLQKSPEAIRFVLFPSFENMASESDSIFAIVFGQDFDKQRFVQPIFIREMIAVDEKFEKMISSIYSKNYTGSELRNRSNLQDTLGAKGMTFLKGKFVNSDLALIPIRFVFKETGGNVAAYTMFRLYDLHTGDLLYQKEHHENSAPGGVMRTGGLLHAAKKDTQEMQNKIESDALYLTDKMIRLALLDFKKYLFKRINSK